MLNTFTLIHIFIVTIFGLMGLRALTTYRGKTVTYRLSVAGSEPIGIKYTDIMFVVACLCYLSLDATSLRFLQACRELMVTGEHKWLIVIAATFYLTSLLCALFYCLRGSCIILYTTARDWWNKRQTKRKG